MDNFDDWLSSLNSSCKAIVVEGKKDENALMKIGIKNRIFTLSKQPVFSVAERIAGYNSEVVILTDFDKKGKELYGRLVTELQSLGVRVDNHYREWLQKNTKLSHIEGIDKLKQ